MHMGTKIITDMMKMVIYGKVVRLMSDPIKIL